MPPTSEATTAVAHAIASRFTIPSGSYTDGHTKTVAAESISRILPIGSISRTQNTPVRDAGQLLHRRRHLGGDLRGVGCAGAQHQLHLGREVVRGRDQMRDALLPGDPPDEGDDRAGRVDAELRPSTDSAPRRALLACATGYQTSVSIPLRTTCTRLGSSAGIGLQHVVAHARADRDHRVGGLDRGLLHPRRHPVAAAELFGLPRPHRFERMRGQHVRDAVQQRGEVPGQPGVPGVRMHDGGLRGGVGHHQIGRQRRQRRVGALERRVGLVHDRARRGAPMQCTSTSHRWRSCATSSVTCTPAPP